MLMIDGAALKATRERKTWTQVELSEATKPKVDVSTISRLERGKPTRVRKNTLRALASALGVEPGELCRRPEPERDPIKLQMSPAARNALALVARRYRISRDSIIEAAPLLFFIAAEQSLKQRQKRLDALEAAADVLYGMHAAVGHLPPNAAIDEFAVKSERKSIAARDLFAAKVFEDQSIISHHGDDFDEAEENPFARFLKASLDEISGLGSAAQPLRWPPLLGPSYVICAEEARLIVGDDEDAVQAILSGAAALHEMPKGETQERRAAWARAEGDRARRAAEDFLRELGWSPDAETGKPGSGEASA